MYFSRSHFKNSQEFSTLLLYKKHLIIPDYGYEDTFLIKIKSKFLTSFPVWVLVVNPCKTLR